MLNAICTFIFIHVNTKPIQTSSSPSFNTSPQPPMSNTIPDTQELLGTTLDSIFTRSRTLVEQVCYICINNLTFYKKLNKHLSENKQYRFCSPSLEDQREQRKDLTGSVATQTMKSLRKQLLKLASMNPQMLELCG